MNSSQQLSWLIINLVIKLRIYLWFISTCTHLVFLALDCLCTPPCMSNWIQLSIRSFSSFTREDIREFSLWDGVSLHFSDGFEECVYACAHPVHVSVLKVFFLSLPLVKLLTAILFLLSSQNTPGKQWQGHRAAPEISPCEPSCLFLEYY